MVVGDDEVDAERGAQRGLLDRGDAAVDRDDELHALPGEKADGGLVEAIAFFDPAGDVAGTLRALPAQKISQQAGRGDAVDVVVAVYSDVLAAFKGKLDTRGGVCHASEQHWVAERIVRGEKSERFFRRAVPAAAEYARGKRTDAGRAELLRGADVIARKVPGSVFQL